MHKSSATRNSSLNKIASRLYIAPIYTNIYDVHIDKLHMYFPAVMETNDEAGFPTDMGHWCRNYVFINNILPSDRKHQNIRLGLLH